MVLNRSLCGASVTVLTTFIAFNSASLSFQCNYVLFVFTENAVQLDVIVASDGSAYCMHYIYCKIHTMKIIEHPTVGLKCKIVFKGVM